MWNSIASSVLNSLSSGGWMEHPLSCCRKRMKRSHMQPEELPRFLNKMSRCLLQLLKKPYVNAIRIGFADF
ncbi:hypothetical protein CEXT_432581 [Caerostris extrusa]|uniref:Uncharacterized protein n=1 Tax=Caerostris extrusa TaxID=172846 RepID=A0AAV4YAM4_CAEEX|nr:hypothetical protein CEXT_432581 [Caerostris extrusa]